MMFLKEVFRADRIKIPKAKIMVMKVKMAAEKERFQKVFYNPLEGLSVTKFMKVNRRNGNHKKIN